MYLTDALSRAHLPRTSDCGQEEFETINGLSNSIMPEEKIHEIPQYTKEDTFLQQLKRMIQEDWPSDESLLPTFVIPYFSVRGGRAVTDGLVFHGEHLVIPNGMQATVKKDVRVGHQGIEACLRHAREHVCWAGMNKTRAVYMLRNEQMKSRERKLEINKD